LILATELKKRLDAAIELRGLSYDHERRVKSAVSLLVADVMKIIREEVNAAKREEVQEDV
jgi:hypothetical protein